MSAKCTRPRFSLFEEIDRGLNHLVSEVLHQESRRTNSPTLAVHEFEDRYVVECDLPGVSLDAIELKVNDGVLEISGNRPKPAMEGGRETLNERSFGLFTRQLKLGSDVRHDAIEAELGNGVLKVLIPKAKAAVPRKIAIRSATNAEQTPSAAADIPTAQDGGTAAAE